MQGRCLLLLISSLWCLVVNVQAGVRDPDERDDQVVIFLIDFNIFSNMISLFDLGFFRSATIFEQRSNFKYIKIYSLRLVSLYSDLSQYTLSCPNTPIPQYPHTTAQGVSLLVVWMVHRWLIRSSVAAFN